MPRRRLDDDASIAEHIAIIALQNDSLAVPKSGIARRLGKGGWPLREHGVALDLTNEPGGAGELVRVSGVIPMVVRQGQVGDVGRRITYFSQLNLQWSHHGQVTRLQVREHNMLQYRSASRFPGSVRDGSGVPNHRSLRMRDEKARHGHAVRRNLFLLKLEPRRI